MIVVGLTGTVGAGKSTVGELFERWGAHRVDTDVLAREVVAPGRPELERVREAFGSEVVDEDGSLDRPALRRRVFADDEARRRLEEILHPAILDLVHERLDAARESGAAVAVVEVPLLFERDLGPLFDVTVAVDAPTEVRWRRIDAERELNRAGFVSTDRAQWSGERKRDAADHVIRNDGTQEELRERARGVWERIVGRPATGGTPDVAGSGSETWDVGDTVDAADTGDTG